MPRISLQEPVTVGPRLPPPSTWYSHAVLEQRAFSKACVQMPGKRAVPSTLRKDGKKPLLAPPPHLVVVAPVKDATPAARTVTSSSHQTPAPMAAPLRQDSAAGASRQESNAVDSSSPLSLGPPLVDVSPSSQVYRGNSTEPPCAVPLEYAAYEAFRSPALSDAGVKRHDSLSVCSDATDGSDAITHAELQQSGRHRPTRRGSGASVTELRDVDTSAVRQQNEDDRALVEPSPMTDGNSPHRGADGADDTAAPHYALPVPRHTTAAQRRKEREARQRQQEAQRFDVERRLAQQRASLLLHKLRKEGSPPSVANAGCQLTSAQQKQQRSLTEKLIESYLNGAATDAARRRMSLSSPPTRSGAPSTTSAAYQSGAPSRRRSTTPRSSAAPGELPPLPRPTSTSRTASASPSPRRVEKATPPSASTSRSPSKQPAAATRTPPASHLRFVDPARLEWSARALPVRSSSPTSNDSRKTGHHHHDRHVICAPVALPVSPTAAAASRSPSLTLQTILDPETHCASHHPPRVATPPPRPPVGHHGETVAVGARPTSHRTPSPQPIGPHGATASASRRGSGSVAGLLGDMTVDQASRRTSRSVSPTTRHHDLDSAM